MLVAALSDALRSDLALQYAAPYLVAMDTFTAMPVAVC
jgi:hypothetical protein